MFFKKIGKTIFVIRRKKAFFVDFYSQALLNPTILTPSPTVEIRSPMPAAPKRKRQRIQFAN